MVVAKSWTMVTHFDGAPKPEDFKMVEEELPALKDGEMLLESVFLSVDPYMRLYREIMKEGDVMAGGMFALQQMKDYGRIAVCGAISMYNDLEPSSGPYMQPYILLKQLRMEGFLLSRWQNRYEEGQKQLLQWVLEGKVKYHEHITNGFENMPAGFMGLLKGENIGKAIIKV